ncbi:MAG: TonB-dependent receptor, partial [Gammaproteobacteria bacterium]
EGSFSFSIDPDRSNEDLFTAFLQQSWRFFDQRLQLTLGSKFEHSSRADGNVQPSVRLSWRPDPANHFWGAVSRAVSTPSLNDSNGRLVLSGEPIGPMAALVKLLGDSDIDSETMIAYELGWRRRFGEVASLDTTVFLHDYDDLLGTMVPGAPVINPLPVPHLELPVTLVNSEQARLHGLEIAANWNLTPHWRLTSSYSFSRLTGLGPFAKLISLPPAEQIVNLGSHVDLGNRWEFDANLRYNDRQPVLDVDAWWSLDLRLGWRPTKKLGLSLIAKELLESEHFEYNDAVGTEVSSQGKALLFKADWHF